MEFSTKGKMFLIAREGICLSPYLDSVNVKTIGIGATVSEIPDIASIPWDKNYSMQEILELLNKGLHKYINAVNNLLTANVAQHQFDALVSLCYNIGTGNVANHKGGLAGSTLIKLINSNSDMLSMAKAFMMWNKPPEILKRRKKETDLFTKGYYGDTKALVFPVNSVNHKPMYSKGHSVDVAELLGL